MYGETFFIDYLSPTRDSERQQGKCMYKDNHKKIENDKIYEKNGTVGTVQ